MTRQDYPFGIFKPFFFPFRSSLSDWVQWICLYIYYSKTLYLSTNRRCAFSSQSKRSRELICFHGLKLVSFEARLCSSSIKLNIPIAPTLNNDHVFWLKTPFYFSIMAIYQTGGIFLKLVVFLLCDIFLNLKRCKYLQK